jgi:hypothetical protein
VKRPKAHEINDRAQLLFEGVLPASWVKRPQSDDYGTDYEVEVFQNGRSTGITFKAQLKGTEHPDYAAGGTLIKHQLESNRASYLCAELKVPTAFAIADLKGQRVYWTMPQLDADLRQRVAAATKSGQDTVVVRVPTANRLPDTTNALLNAIADAQTYLGVRTVVESPVPHFTTVVTTQFDPQTVVTELLSKAATIQVEQIRSLYSQRDYSRASEVVAGILESRGVNAEIKVAALIEAERGELGKLQEEGRYHDAFAKSSLRFAAQMKEASVGGPAHLRYYAAVAHRTAELQLLAFEDWGRYENWLAVEAAGDPYWRLELSHLRQQTAKRIVRKYTQCFRILRQMLRAQHYAPFPQSVARVLGAMVPFVFRLYKEGLDETAENYRRSLRGLAENAVGVSVALRQWGDVGFVVLSAAHLRRSLAEEDMREVAEWAGKLLDRVEDEAQRDQFRAWLAADAAHLQGLPRQKTADDHDAVEKQIYYNMATSLGIDLNDEDDPIAAIVNQGIADLNPERVLRYCQHLFVSLGGASNPVAAWLRLPTAGTKRLHCTKHGQSIEGFALDDCLAAMKEHHCNKCPDFQPHDSEWKWTSAWQQDQNRVHSRLVLREERPRGDQQTTL